MLKNILIAICLICVIEACSVDNQINYLTNNSIKRWGCNSCYYDNKEYGISFHSNGEWDDVYSSFGTWEFDTSYSKLMMNGGGDRIEEWIVVDLNDSILHVIVRSDKHEKLEFELRPITNDYDTDSLLLQFHIIKEILPPI